MRIAETLSVKDLENLPSKPLNSKRFYSEIYVKATNKKHESGFRQYRVIGSINGSLELICLTDNIIWDFKELSPKLNLRMDILNKNGLHRYFSDYFIFSIDENTDGTRIFLVPPISKVHS